MDKTYSIAKARNDFSSIVREAESGRPVTLSRRGRPVAVVVSAATTQAVAPEHVARTIAELRAFRANCRTGRIDLRALIETGRR